MEKFRLGNINAAADPELGTGGGGSSNLEKVGAEKRKKKNKRQYGVGARERQEQREMKELREKDQQERGKARKLREGEQKADQEGQGGEEEVFDLQDEQFIDVEAEPVRDPRMKMNLSQGSKNPEKKSRWKKWREKKEGQKQAQAEQAKKQQELANLASDEKAVLDRVKEMLQEALKEQKILHGDQSAAHRSDYIEKVEEIKGRINDAREMLGIALKDYQGASIKEFQEKYGDENGDLSSDNKLKLTQFLIGDERFGKEQLKVRVGKLSELKQKVLGKWSKFNELPGWKRKLLMVTVPAALIGGASGVVAGSVATGAAMGAGSIAWRLARGAFGGQVARFASKRMMKDKAIFSKDKRTREEKMRDWQQELSKGAFLRDQSGNPNWELIEKVRRKNQKEMRRVKGFTVASAIAGGGLMNIDLVNVAESLSMDGVASSLESAENGLKSAMATAAEFYGLDDYMGGTHQAASMTGGAHGPEVIKAMPNQEAAPLDGSGDGRVVENATEVAAGEVDFTPEEQVYLGQLAGNKIDYIEGGYELNDKLEKLLSSGDGDEISANEISDLRDKLLKDYFERQGLDESQIKNLENEVFDTFYGKPVHVEFDDRGRIANIEIGEAPEAVARPAAMPEQWSAVPVGSTEQPIVESESFNLEPKASVYGTLIGAGKSPAEIANLLNNFASEYPGLSREQVMTAFAQMEKGEGFTLVEGGNGELKLQAPAVTERLEKLTGAGGDKEIELARRDGGATAASPDARFDTGETVTGFDEAGAAENINKWRDAGDGSRYRFVSKPGGTGFYEIDSGDGEFYATDADGVRDFLGLDEVGIAEEASVPEPGLGPEAASLNTLTENSSFDEKAVGGILENWNNGKGLSEDVFKAVLRGGPDEQGMTVGDLRRNDFLTGQNIWQNRMGASGAGFEFSPATDEFLRGGAFNGLSYGEASELHAIGSRITGFLADKNPDYLDQLLKGGENVDNIKVGALLERLNTGNADFATEDLRGSSSGEWTRAGTSSLPRELVANAPEAETPDAASAVEGPGWLDRVRSGASDLHERQMERARGLHENQMERAGRLGDWLQRTGGSVTETARDVFDGGHKDVELDQQVPEREVGSVPLPEEPFVATTEGGVAGSGESRATEEATLNLGDNIPADAEEVNMPAFEDTGEMPKWRQPRSGGGQSPSVEALKSIFGQ